MTLTLGEREIQVLHHDRAVTPGDTFLYLPADKILITGDLLVNPFGIRAEQLPDGLAADARDISTRWTPPSSCPGTASRCATKRPAARTMDVMRELLKQERTPRRAASIADQAREEVFPRLRDLMVTMTRDDPKANEQFKRLFRRLVHAPRLRRAERSAHRCDFAPIPRAEISAY